MPEWFVSVRVLLKPSDQSKAEFYDSELKSALSEFRIISVHDPDAADRAAGSKITVSIPNVMALYAFGYEIERFLESYPETSIQAETDEWKYKFIFSVPMPQGEIFKKLSSLLKIEYVLGIKSTETDTDSSWIHSSPSAAEPELPAAEPAPPRAATPPQPPPPPLDLCLGEQPDEPPYVRIRIFYATDRQRDVVTYGKERNPEGCLSLGTCDVTIPHDHRMGDIERPSIWRLEFREDPKKHMILLHVEPKEEQRFWAELSTTVNESKNKETFVFVHGYDNSFEDAALRTAQMAYDLRFDGAPICYSWPSQGELAAYPIDETNAQWTVPHLKNFLTALAEKSQAKTIHVIAHSMGNRVVSYALQLLAAEVKTHVCRMRHLVLAAPDIDADTFKELAEAIKSVSDHVTLYFSPLDKALMASKKFHGYPRLGEMALVIAGIDTIDASAVDTSFIGHSYFGENRSVLSDIFALLKDGKPPLDRFGMRQVQDSAGIYYAFRP